MFILILVIFVICGVLLLLTARKISDKKGLRIAIGVCGIGLVVLGAVLAYNLISGNIVLPLR